jgi:hypothetical protein
MVFFHASYFNCAFDYLVPHRLFLLKAAFISFVSRIKASDATPSDLHRSIPRWCRKLLSVVGRVPGAAV